MQETKRQFRGVWIPKHIWLDQRLNYFEKAVYAEIDSLSGDYGCFASNEYLASFLCRDVRSIQAAIAHLEELNYIERTVIKGNKRVIKLVENFPHRVKEPSPKGDENIIRRVTKTSFVGCAEHHPLNSYNIDYNIDYSCCSNDDHGEMLKTFKIGAGELRLTDSQMDILLDKLGLEGFDFYAAKLTDWREKHPDFKIVRSDYKTILKWAEEDRRT